MPSQNNIVKNTKNGVVAEVLTGCDCKDACCCDFEIVTENTVEASKEKHIPVISATANGIRIDVGSVAHPMEEKHFIEWIEVINGPYVNRKYLKPNEAPVAEFYVKMQPGLVVRAYCNIHGLWKA